MDQIWMSSSMTHSPFSQILWHAKTPDNTVSLKHSWFLGFRFRLQLFYYTRQNMLTLSTILSFFTDNLDFTYFDYVTYKCTSLTSHMTKTLYMRYLRKLKRCIVLSVLYFTS